MRRQITEELIDNLRAELSSQLEKGWNTYECKLVTPMYGGGVKAGEVDKAMPIRASAIRGHLRFWWRIACGPKSLKEETAIWGGIGKERASASQVEIRVTSKPINAGQLESSKSIKGFGIKYILGAAETTNCLRSNYQFDLQIRYRDKVSEEAKEQVVEALRWWASFGGIGGRTRRGFGALDIKGLEPISIKVVEDKGGKLAYGPTLYNTAEEAWQEAAQRLYLFRQGKEVGRSKGEDKRPGRSRWPEPDQLRRMTNNYKTNHKPVHLAGNVFPRAAFGLPIMFDFNDKTRKEPQTMTLLPKDAQRMASPLVIRPYKEGDKWRAEALLLPKWEDALVETLELSPSPSKVEPQSWPNADQQAQRSKLAQNIKPMQGRGDDPLSAFLNFFEKG